MKFEDIQAEWEQDCTIDTSRIDAEVRKVPLLHGKYWQIFISEKRKHIEAKKEFDGLRRDKFDWYLGRLDDERRNARGWPLQQLRIVRTEADHYLSTDADLIQLRSKLDVMELKLKYVEDIIKSVSFRSNLIKNHVEWLKFSQGA